MPTHDPRDILNDEALKTMRETVLLFRDIVNPACRRRGLTLQQFYVLSELANDPHQTASDLADRVGILRTNFAAVCRKLERGEFITRERDADDRRKILLDLTEKGKAEYHSIVDEASTVLDHGAYSMSEEDYTSIRDGVANLHKLLRAATGR